MYYRLFSCLWAVARWFMVPDTHRLKLHGCRLIIGLALGLNMTTPARAVTLRYAIVVGNNTGMDETGAEPFARLQHAEYEAELIRDRLVDLCNFDPDPRRTILLKGATRMQVAQAVDVLKQTMQEDTALLGDIDTLFLFFFTGHGLNERLLLNDGPMTGDELGEVFTAVSADFTIGIFDACHSGSLDTDFTGKGIEPTPGLNLFQELPEEVLKAEGSIWFVSSGPEQASYEDPELGGIFTHFFVEALSQADRDGPGITLDRIWHYASEKTVSYTTARNRHQVPEQFVTRLKSTGPLYFSFPAPRSATIVMEEAVEGHFVLSYSGGQLTEMITKQAGEKKEVAVYPGKAWLMLMEDGNIMVQEEIELLDGSVLVLHTNPDPIPTEAFGSSRKELWEKGMGNSTLTATVIEPKSTWLMGVGYDFVLFKEGLLAPQHVMSFDVRLMHDYLTGGVKVGFGLDARELGTWSYELNALVGEVWAGWLWQTGIVRLTLTANVGGGAQWEEFGDGQTQLGALLMLGVGFGVTVPLSSWLAVSLQVRGGALWAPSAGLTDEYLWDGFGSAGVSFEIGL